MTMKQYPFCEIKFVFHFAAFLRLPFQTTQSCDQRGFSIYCFPLIRGSSNCQRAGGKVNFLLDLDSASKREKEIRTWVSAHGDPAGAQRRCGRTELEGAGAKVQHQGMTGVFQKSIQPWQLNLLPVERSQPTWSHLNTATGLLPP